MADGNALAAVLLEAPGVSFIGLCLNERGVERAVASSQGSRGIDEIDCEIALGDALAANKWLAGIMNKALPSRVGRNCRCCVRTAG